MVLIYQIYKLDSINANNQIHLTNRFSNKSKQIEYE